MSKWYKFMLTSKEINQDGRLDGIIKMNNESNWLIENKLGIYISKNESNPKTYYLSSKVKHYFQSELNNIIISECNKPSKTDIDIFIGNDKLTELD